MNPKGEFKFTEPDSNKKNQVTTKNSCLVPKDV